MVQTHMYKTLHAANNTIFGDLTVQLHRWDFKSEILQIHPAELQSKVFSVLAHLATAESCPWKPQKKTQKNK